MDDTVTCHVCRSGTLSVFEEFSLLHQVTSDCRPWPPGARLGICTQCGTVQRLVNDHWRGEAARIYAGYEIYHQSGGAEQPVFDPGTGSAEPRSDRVVRELMGSCGVGNSGRWLDIGCGNGAFLRAISRQRPQWRLAGVELGERSRAAVQAIPGVEVFHAGPLATLAAEPFDAISMIHVLEHIENPVEFLHQVRPRIAPGGLLLIQVPDCVQNPFDLLVADHCSHFSLNALKSILAHAGFEVLVATDRWVSKELSVVARPNERAAATWRGDGDLEATVREHVRRLAEGAQRARELAARGERVGIFGTSIGGTWLFAETAGAASFFVDEDANRTGRRLLGLEVLLPRDAPEGSVVLLPLAEVVRRSVIERLAHLPLRFIAVA